MTFQLVHVRPDRSCRPVRRVIGSWPEVLARARIGIALENDGSVLRAMLGLGRIAITRGDWARAEAINTEALARAHQIGSRWADYFLIALALAAQARGDDARAAQRHAQALQSMHHMRNAHITLISLEGIAITAAQTAPADAARLLGAAAALRRQHMTSPLASDRPGYDAAIEAAALRLGHAAFPAAWEAGTRLTLAMAIDEALALVATAGDPASAATPPGAVPSPLTPREQDVLRRIVAGLSDMEIAAALGISRRTASNHVASIRARLDAPSRAALAAIAVRDSLI